VKLQTQRTVTDLPEGSVMLDRREVVHCGIESCGRSAGCRGGLRGGGIGGGVRGIVRGGVRGIVRGGGEGGGLSVEDCSRR
jgi:hypothetical protein